MSTFLGLGQNIALLLSLTFIYGLVDPRLERFSTRRREVITGVLFGSFGLISMMVPIQVYPGLFQDGRTVITLIAGIFGGPVPAIIAGIMVIIYRTILSGAGTPGGVASIATAVVLGIVTHRYLQSRSSEPSGKLLMLLGVTQALASNLWGLLLNNVGLSVIGATLSPTLLLYPTGTLLIGTLIKYQRHNQEMELNLRNDQRRFLAIFNSAFQLTVLIKPDGTVLEANQAALDFGNAKHEDVVGRPIWESGQWAYTEEKQQQLKDAFKRAALGEFVRFEIELQNAKKQWVNIDFSVKPVQDASGNLEMILFEGRDITNLKQLEAQKVDLLLERERGSLLKKFISDVSHDLRTPLAVMRLNLDLLSRTTDPQKQKQRIETLASQEQHLAQLLTDMMTMVSFDDHRSTFRFKVIDPYFVAQLVFDEHHNAARNKKQKLLFNHGTETLRIQADQAELEQALNKLYDNALTYTPPDGTITLSVYELDNHAVFELRDTGIGISASDLPEIFNHFFRADDSRNIHNGGAGLGLSIVKKIAEIHGGSIEAESTLGKGSTFRLMLPLVSPEAEQPTDARLYR
jgi:PAS domain S-box-containing protein